MNYVKGWVKFHRKLLEWGWYQDVNVRLCFFHMLLITNHKDKEWMGKIIKRGQFYTSYGSFANQVGLSIKQVRNAFSKLEKTNEITQKRAGNGQTVTLINWELYQSKEDEVADLGQTLGRLGATTEEVKNLRSKEVKNKRENNNRKHSFLNSPYFDKHKFAEAFSDPKYKDVDLAYWYERATEYSEANGGTYKNWALAIMGWIRRAKEEGKTHGFKTAPKEVYRPPIEKTWAQIHEE